MNNVNLIGRLTKDIELRYTQSNMAVARFTLAIDEGFGEKKKTNFINCLAFGKTAENMEKFVGKGQRIALQGHITTGQYEKDGQKHYTTDVIADRVEFLEWGDKKQSDAERIANAAPLADQTDVPQGFAAIDEDIPF